MSIPAANSHDQYHFYLSLYYQGWSVYSHKTTTHRPKAAVFNPISLHTLCASCGPHTVKNYVVFTVLYYSKLNRKRIIIRKHAHGITQPRRYHRCELIPVRIIRKRKAWNSIIAIEVNNIRFSS